MNVKLICQLVQMFLFMIFFLLLGCIYLVVFFFCLFDILLFTSISRLENWPSLIIEGPGKFKAKYYFIAIAAWFIFIRRKGA